MRTFLVYQRLFFYFPSNIFLYNLFSIFQSIDLYAHNLVAVAMYRLTVALIHPVINILWRMYVDMNHTKNSYPHHIYWISLNIEYCFILLLCWFEYICFWISFPCFSLFGKSWRKLNLINCTTLFFL